MMEKVRDLMIRNILLLKDDFCYLEKQSRGEDLLSLSPFERGE